MYTACFPNQWWEQIEYRCYDITYLYARVNILKLDFVVLGHSHIIFLMLYTNERTKTKQEARKWWTKIFHLWPQLSDVSQISIPSHQPASSCIQPGKIFIVQKCFNLTMRKCPILDYQLNQMLTLSNTWYPITTTI